LRNVCWDAALGEVPQRVSGPSLTAPNGKRDASELRRVEPLLPGATLQEEDLLLMSGAKRSKSRICVTGAH
jgi:hypothetical protein